MPELPEVETTKRGLIPLIVNRTVRSVHLHQPKLRWEIPPHLTQTLLNQVIMGVIRRGKYLLIEFKIGVLIIHLGMSGSLKVVEKSENLQKHQHFELCFENQTCLRLNDPRRFGCVLFSADGKHKLLDNLGVEPLTHNFKQNHLFIKSRNKQQAIKTFIMDSKIVVGVGNIYASESLYLANINPQRAAGGISKKRYQILTNCIQQILKDAIKAGGTSLRNFSNVEGKLGYFSQTLSVYAKEGKPCNTCAGKIRRMIQNQRATFYCPKCQT